MFVFQQLQMIVFDQNPIAKRMPVIRASAKSHRPFLNRPPPRDRFPRIENGDAAVHGPAKSLCERSNAGKLLQEVQRDPSRVAEQQWQQARSIVASCNWDIRAAEWEAAAQTWLT